jgi:hypothetical protein
MDLDEAPSGERCKSLGLGPSEREREREREREGNQDDARRKSQMTNGSG